MSSKGFTFKQFDIQHDRCAMKVGTDGVLLGAWANGGQRILDIGIGTALIALMMAQRCADAAITGVDIDHDAVQQARDNVNRTPFADRIGIIESPVQKLTAETHGQFDAIVCNPPFFTDSLKNPNQQRAVARHADTLPYRQLFQTVARLLSADGEFSAVIPSDCLSAFSAEAYMANLTLSRRCDIRTTQHKQPKRCLVAFRHASCQHEFCAEEHCLQEADGSRSEWYQQLTSDFYIK
ncbi:tRNA1(Val) (adenine(37)-N6)-methyltransferase [Prevotella sp.]|uniref:tRNA1(Val) (adenine(37)-N6)-methyltransferase n=1 Tax=Prevotella sp. TaxID=59823 RepID=UPI003078C705